MRSRLTQSERRANILAEARRLFIERGFEKADMENIRLACEISRGGLYHHFSSKRAILDALVEEEVHQMADALAEEDASPIIAVLQAGSIHLTGDAGILAALRSQKEKLDYLSALEQSFETVLSGVLRARIERIVRDDIKAEHVSELFLSVNAHINRCEILGRWTGAEAADFAATSLEALKTLLKDCSQLDPVISDLKKQANSR